jgi:hypothetical protein
MANIFHDRINGTSVVTQAEEDNDDDQEKVDSLLEKDDKVKDEEKKIEHCNLIKRFLRAISLG